MVQELILVDLLLEVQSSYQSLIMTLSFPNLQILDKNLVQQKVIVVWATKLLTSVNLVKNNKSFTKSLNMIGPNLELWGKAL